jgi:hypothetical protein
VHLLACKHVGVPAATCIMATLQAQQRVVTAGAAQRRVMAPAAMMHTAASSGRQMVRVSCCSKRLLRWQASDNLHTAQGAVSYRAVRKHVASRSVVAKVH